MRKTFVTVATKMLDENPKTSLLLGDIGVFGFRKTMDKYPERCMNLGILEQSMLGVAAGLASEGIIPTVHTIAPFLVERALEQIKVDFGYQNLPLNLVSVGASFDYSSLGGTHHCPADINILSNVPGVRIFIPGHHQEFEEMFNNNWNSGAINYFRLSESQNPVSIANNLERVTELNVGSRATAYVVGPIMNDVLDIFREFEVSVVYVNEFRNDLHLFKSEFLSGKIILIEPFYSGRLFREISSNLQNNVEILEIGVPVAFSRVYGSYSDQLKAAGLDSLSIRKKVKVFLGT